MSNVIEQIAGVGFSIRYPLVDRPDPCEEGAYIDPTPYTWKLRGRPASQSSVSGNPSFELTSSSGITIETSEDDPDEKEVVCTFRDQDTTNLLGVYRAQLVGTRDGHAALGTEVDPFKFVAKY